ncbi:MAG: hypothetical protein PHY48_15640 [Candidatus Cloacimonetes bacterium]|nr:hypothetical protein [Candidatus Cloacimonadota bacterium]
MSLSIVCMTECVNYFSGVGSDQIIWSWSEDGETYARTNTYTIFSLRMFSDLNFDNNIDSIDYAAASSLTEHGWGMPVASNTLCKVELKTDLLIPGHLILSLTGDAQLRVWTTATPSVNDTPLLIAGQTITNGVDGASFGAYPSSTIYIEAISSGTATLTYSYVGTDNAGGFGYHAQLDITAFNVEFIEDETTDYNFSPSLGEEAKLKVNILPSSINFDYSHYYFKIKIVRKVNGGGEQLIDWVDVDDPHYSITANIDFDSKLFTWNGIPSVFGNCATQAQGVDEFQGVSTTAKRILPSVIQGQPVPPPLYTAVAGIYRSSDQSLVCEASHKIFVPQVVKMMYDTASVDQMLAGYYTDDTGEAMILPIPTNQWPSYRAQIAAQAESYYSIENVNIRFVDSTTSVSQPYSVMQIDGANYAINFIGEAPFDSLNANPSQTGMLYYLRFMQEIGDICFLLREEGMPLPSPITSDEVVYLCAHVGAHETGHTLGLVAYELLGGDASGNHNQFPFDDGAFNVMDPGERRSIYQKMGRAGSGWSFRSLNSEYLRFILPKQ